MDGKGISMTQLEKSLDFLQNVQRCYESSLNNDLLNPFRIKAWERFLHLGLPKRKSEDYHSMLFDLYQSEYLLASKKKIEKKRIESFILPECQHSYIVFLDGHFDPELSDVSAYGKSAVLLSLKDAMRSYGIFLQNRLSKSIQEEKDPFACLNGALYSEGAFFYLSPGQKVKAPLQVLHLITQTPALFTPRMQIFLSEDSSLCSASTFGVLCENKPFFYNYLLDVSLENQSDFNHTSYQGGLGEGMLFEALRATLKSKSTLKTVSLTAAEKVRQDYKIFLLEEEAKAVLKGISLLKKNDFSQVKIEARHLAPNCLSDQMFKGILEDQSRHYFEGKIYVDPIAQKTEAYQLNKNLLLSEEAFSSSKPNLEILADDVKASHGMTASALDLKELFYLQSRGISFRQAKALLIEGYCQEIADHCPINSLKNQIIHIAKAFS